MELNFEKHCWAEIDLDALRRNYERICQNAKDVPVCAVVKADAYGHGDVAVAKALSRCGAQWFAVSCLSEAMRLRMAGIRGEILILGYTDPSQARRLAKHNITQTVFSLEYAQALADQTRKKGKPAREVKCHLKVDTGMGRIGFAARDDLERAVEEMGRCFEIKGLKVTGLFQHFAVADSEEAEDTAYTARQQELFLQVLQRLEDKGRHIKTAHCCNSAGQLTHPEWGLNLMRAGIILYGEDPSSQVHCEGLEPVMTLKATVSQVKDLAAGDSVSYGRAFTADRPMRVATLCCGYADGYPRLLSGKGVVSLHGQAAPVLGRVCMDQMIVDVTHIPETKMGDEACIFGGKGPQDSASAAAERIGTISYELLCGVSRRVPRIYRENGKVVNVADYLK